MKSASPNQPQVQVPSRDASVSLNAEVDERVFGHRVAWRGNFAYRADVLGDTQIRDLVADCYALHAVVPDYSTDIGAARLVLDKMAGPGFRVDITAHGSGQYDVAWMAMEEDGTWSHLTEETDVESLPLAICRASLIYPARAAAPEERDEATTVR